MNWEARAKQLQTELSLANAEIAKLRRRMGQESAHGKRVDRAWFDALLLANLHIAHIETTRRNAEELLAMTNNRWENARALMKLAKVHGDKRWLLHDLATIEESLSEAKELALNNPSAFRSRLPKHARPQRQDRIS